MNGMTDAQMKTFSVDSDHAGLWCHRQSRLLHIVCNRCGMILIHMIEHVALTTAWASKGVGQCHVVQPVNRAEAADVTPANRLQHPEIKIVNTMVVARLGEITVVALGRSVHDSVISKLLGLGNQGKSPGGLYVLCATLSYEQRAARVGLHVFRVLGDAADQY